MNIFRQSRYTPFPLFLAAALFIVVGPIFWMGVEAPGRDRPRLVPENAELYQEILPMMHYGYHRLRAGEAPLWNDRQLCGAPFFADPRHGLLQPLNLCFLFLDTPRALALHAFLALSLMGFFFVLYTRSLGATHIASALGGLVYVCCGATAAAMSRPGIANALVWLPLLCWILRAYYNTPRFRTVAVGGVVLALLLLSGSLLMALVASGFCALYACALLFFDGDTGPVRNQTDRMLQGARRFGPLLMLFIALALSAVQWLPTLFWLLTLENSGAYIGRFSVAGVMPGSLRMLPAQLLQARPGALPSLGYVGISTLLLLPAAFLHGIPRWERAFFGCAATLPVLFAVWFGAGAPEGLYAALFYPSVFSVAVLAALGADRLFTPRRDSFTPRFWIPLLLVALVFVVVFVIAPAPTRGRMLPLALSLGVFALFRARWASVLSSMVLVVFLFVDLSAASANYHGHPFFDGNEAAQAPAPAAALIHNTALDDRVMISAPRAAAGLHANIGMTGAFRVAGGIGFPLTSDQAQWWRALQGVAEEDAGFDSFAPLDVSGEAPHALLLNVMSARAVAAVEGGGLASGSAPGLRLRLRGAENGVVVYANENAIPRLSWARSWRLALDMAAAIDALGDAAFDARRECVVLPSEPAVSHLARTAPDSRAVREYPVIADAARLSLIADAPERLEAAVENAAPGILVVSDTHAPGWRAYVNGRPVPILRVNGLFRGLALGPGEHHILFTYRPRPVIVGAAISGVAFCALALLVIADGLRGLRRNQETAPPK